MLLSLLKRFCLPCMSNIEYKFSNILRGGIIYTCGDSVAALISGEFSFIRFAGILLIGATLYAFEIPNYFKWIDKKTSDHSGIKASLYRTLLAILYFNPLWITRHLFFIKLISLRTGEISLNLFQIGLWSFLVNIPISLLCNFIIQNKIPLKWRFLASAIFSSIMAIYYAMSAVWFK